MRGILKTLSIIKFLKLSTHEMDILHDSKNKTLSLAITKFPLNFTFVLILTLTAALLGQCINI